ncbi:MAG TPA: glycyl-radical enzyme activating protein [Bacteroidales bacterium]|nr:glycyl-radical enzyme activating protein [Bacteroidales bacterium]HPF02417.1 glycyl-radical enzyme activating protein [Bacteroidales bacterium]HPJ60616.1 glycyl-radical enzyme activating protein [Bacteroidales bacterium]HPR11110.1 glycyl-radical enzyme activating protein [Bacteroidales bacterium]HRW84789.1 glycyl-radical enzyme activating protein [Bacteroidales bacterium]
MQGLIFSIKRYTIHDGPGIRVTVFMKGCPLSCWWCHNPEGILPEPEYALRIDRVGEREFEVKEKAGRYYSSEQIVEILDRERIFIEESRGGVTFSGGEPLLQPSFLLKTLIMCREKGYHTAVDTSGYAETEDLLAVIPHTDLFLYDLKHLDAKKHLLYTGVSNEQIIKNLHVIIKSGKDIMIRFPVIPGINDDDEHLGKMRSFLSETASGSIKKLSLLPYHKTGSSKYSKFGIKYRMNGIESPSPERMKELGDFFAETGIAVKTGG